MRHGLVPDLKSDDVIGNQAEESNQALLDVISPGCQNLPMTSNLGVIRRIGKNTLNKNI